MVLLFGSIRLRDITIFGGAGVLEERYINHAVISEAHPPLPGPVCSYGRTGVLYRSTRYNQRPWLAGETSKRSERNIPGVSGAAWVPV